MKFTILVVEKKIVWEIYQFYSFLTKITSLLGGGREIYNDLSPHPTNVTYQIWSILAL